MFTYEILKEKGQYILDNIQAEYKHIQLSTLGGKENACAMLRISLDKKENWEYSIFHNSRYYHFSIDKNGTIENFSCGHRVKKIRKKTVKTIDEAIKYINAKLEAERNA